MYGKEHVCLDKHATDIMHHVKKASFVIQKFPHHGTDFLTQASSSWRSALTDSTSALGGTRLKDAGARGFPKEEAFGSPPRKGRSGSRAEGREASHAERVRGRPHG